MSEILVDNLTGKTSAGSVTVTSEGGAATQSLQQGLSKAWLYAQQRTATVEAKNSLNVSSWVDDATGRCTTNLTNAMSNTNYIILVSDSYNATSGSGLMGRDEGWPTSSSQIKHDMTDGGGTFYDCDYVYNSIQGDLA